MLLQCFQIGALPGVGESVQYNDVMIRVFLRPLAGKARADKTGSAGDENVHKNHPEKSYKDYY